MSGINRLIQLWARKQKHAFPNTIPLNCVLQCDEMSSVFWDLQDIWVGVQRKNESIMCIWKPDVLFIRIKTTINKELIICTVTVKLCCSRPRNCRSADTDDRIKERLVSGNFTLIYLPPHTQSNSLCNAKTTVPNRLSFQPVNNSYPQSHHGDPSEGGHALAHGRKMVELRRGAVLLAETLHLLDGFGHRLQEGRQNCLKRKEFTQ